MLVSQNWSSEFDFNILLIVYLHNETDLMFVSMAVTPVDISVFQMGISNTSDVLMVEARLTERHQTSLDNSESHCKNYDNDKIFKNCVKDFFTRYFKENTNCSLPGEFTHCICNYWMYSFGKKLLTLLHFGI